MKRIAILLTISLLTLDAMALLTGCTNQTEGQRTITKANQMQDAGDMIRQGELLVENGKANEARGQTLKSQGSNFEGDKLIAEGKADQKKGNELISQGRKLRDQAK